MAFAALNAHEKKTSRASLIAEKCYKFGNAATQSHRVNRDMKDKKRWTGLKHKDGLLWRRTQIACAVFMGLYRFTNTKGTGDDTHWANAFPYRAAHGD